MSETDPTPTIRELFEERRAGLLRRAQWCSDMLAVCDPDVLEIGLPKSHISLMIKWVVAHVSEGEYLGLRSRLAMLSQGPIESRAASNVSEAITKFRFPTFLEPLIVAVYTSRNCRPVRVREVLEYETYLCGEPAEGMEILEELD